MKIPATFAFGAAAAALLGTSASADNLRVPSSVYTMDKFEEAAEKAAEDSSPIVIVYTNPGST